jgi:small subunit ribosomal protein S16
MSVRIRLRRIGKNPKKRYFFRIAVFNKTRSRDSRSIEGLGYYDSSKKPALIKINRERLDHWLSHGAQMSDTVKSLVKKYDTG